MCATDRTDGEKETGVATAARRPLRENVRDQLRERIIDGTYRPGDRIVERDVAADFSVSRLPVREALRMLNTEGFVEMLATRGVVVRQLSHHDVDELFDVREALESLAFRRAAEKVTKKDCARLTALATKATTAVGDADFAAVQKLNEEFHDLVIVLARNDLLASLLGPLEGRLHWLFRQNDDPALLWKEHQELLDAIIGKDAELAASLAVGHVRINRTRANEYLYGANSARSTEAS